MRRTFLVDKGRIDAVLDKGRLMFHRFVDNGVQPVIGHGLEKIGRQFFSRQEILIVGIRSRGPCPALPRTLTDLSEIRRILCFLTRFIRRRRASAQVICEGLFFVSEASRPFRKQFFELWNDHGVDDHGAGSVELRDGLVEYLCDFAEIFRGRLCGVTHRLAQDTNARSLQTFWVEKHGVTIRYMTHTPGRKRVFRVVAYDNVQELRQIGNGTGHGAERSRNGWPPRVNSTAAHKAGRRTHSDDRVPGRRAADRRKTFLSDPYRTEVRCDAGPGTTGRTSRRSLRIVRVTRRAEKGAMGITAAELTQGRLC